MEEQIFDNIGIRIKMADIPGYVAYAKLRDELELMHPIRHWLSFRKRRELDEARLMVQAAILDAVITESLGPEW